MPLIGSDLVPQTDGNLAELGRVGRFPVTDEAVLIVKDGGPHAEEGRILNHVEVPLFNALNSRPDLASAFDHLFTNKRLWLAIAFGTLAQVAVVELPFLRRGVARLRGGREGGPSRARAALIGPSPPKSPCESKTAPFHDRSRLWCALWRLTGHELVTGV